MADKLEKRKAGNYEITQGIWIGGQEVVFGVDETNDMPYFCAFYTSNDLIASYYDGMVGDDYVEMVELFIERVKEQCIKVREECEKVTVPREKMTKEMCLPFCGNTDLRGKVAVVKAEVLRPEYRSSEHQLVLVTGGNGAHGERRGRACFCTELYSGNRSRWNREDIQGEIREECLPQWAKERREEIRKKEIGSDTSERQKNEEKKEKHIDCREM